MSKILSRYLKSSIAKGFVAWRAQHAASLTADAQEARRVAVLESCARRMRLHAVTRVWNAWEGMVVSRVRMRRLFSSLGARTRSRLLRSSLHTWHACSLRMRLAAAFWLKSSQRGRRTVLRHAWAAWFTFHTNFGDAKDVLSHILRRRHRSAATMAFSRWHRFVRDLEKIALELELSKSAALLETHAERHQQQFNQRFGNLLQSIER